MIVTEIRPISLQRFLHQQLCFLESTKLFQRPRNVHAGGCG